jgi:hypothetical protein
MDQENKLPGKAANEKRGHKKEKKEKKKREEEK